MARTERNCAALPVAYLVAGILVRGLLLRAKHLFVAASILDAADEPPTA